MKNGFRQTSQTSYLKVIFKSYLKFSALNVAICSRRTEAKISSPSSDAAALLQHLGGLNLCLTKILKPRGH
ncbi:hypothetical protein [uncultured Campylobacter sp.]|uniref:hypothetical protein n=1 Tax=uncultured Campylobacter sp. TaxID=218934 RepID=UPI00262D325F|nr:hypothetical protein [uncultured Campylobacter sp.]